jgi:hypothetical protein
LSWPQRYTASHERAPKDAGRDHKPCLEKSHAATNESRGWAIAKNHNGPPGSTRQAPTVKIYFSGREPHDYLTPSHLQFVGFYP